MQSFNPRPSVSIPKYKAAPAPSVHPMTTRSKTRHLLTSSPQALVSSLEPNTIHEALLDSQWVKAIEEEFTALQKNNTWELVPFMII